MSILDKIFGDANKRQIKKLQPLVNKVSSLEKDFEKLSNEDLRAKTNEFKKRFKSGETLDNLLPEAFAVVREASKRTLKMRHFDVQILGGIVLHQGKVTEMKTGEGKTLVATLPVYLNSLTGRGVHVVTVNEYLAQRDAEWMGAIYKFLGLTVGVILHGQSLKEKQEAYKKDVTYGTNNEFGFDYLRDNMVADLDHTVQRNLDYAIVDEVDSILIDEARTPLIISAPAEESTDRYYEFARLVSKLKENEDFNIDEKMRAATLTEQGISKIEKMLGVGNIYKISSSGGGLETIYHLEQALRARTLFHKDKDYVVKDGEVIIVDEFTGRLMPGRRYSEGLHQAIEAKEGVEIQRESKTLATITFQNYFRMYKKLAGMTGTAATEAEEFAKIYKLDVLVIPTNEPMIRVDLNDRIYKTHNGKFKAVAEEIKERHKKGQPVLVGTVSIENNEKLSELLDKEGIPHQVLNAKHHEKEASIIAQAGKLGAVTVATNMAGRGVDIVLGGNPPDLEEQKKVIGLGGLHVIGTERHEARRIDNQLRGRSGRQGDPGSSQFFVSVEDDLMRIFGSDRIKAIMETLRVPEDQPIEHSLISKSIESAQKKVEGNNFDIRKHLVEYDDVMNKHREVIYKRRKEILMAWEIEKARLKSQEIRKSGSQKIKGLKQKVLEIIEAEIEQVVSIHTASDNESEWNTEEIFETIKTIFPADDSVHIKIEEFKKDAGENKDDIKARHEIAEYLIKLAREAYERKEKDLGGNIMRQIERIILLKVIDTLWIDHLDAMANLREGIGLRGYGQRDPLVEYKKEGFLMFQNLLASIQNKIAYTIYKVGVVVKQRSPMETEKISMSGGGESKISALKPEKVEKIGRNDPCPCGSGKKYKKCCGK